MLLVENTCPYTRVIMAPRRRSCLVCGALLGGAVFITCARMHPRGTTLRPYVAEFCSLHAIAVTSGASHACAITTNHEVGCWGRNKYGQLGLGDQVPRDHAIVINGLNHIIQIAAGRDHTCALEQTGRVYCWGLNGMHQVSSDNAHVVLRPRSIALSVPALKIAAGGFHTCALLNRGQVACWGFNGTGQTGQPVSNTTITPENYENLIACLESDQCADYQDVRATETIAQPVPVGGLSTVADLAVGELHTCVRAEAGWIDCWGSNHYGELGPRGRCTACSNPLRNRCRAGDELILYNRQICCRGAVSTWCSDHWGYPLAVPYSSVDPRARFETRSSLRTSAERCTPFHRDVPSGWGIPGVVPEGPRTTARQLSVGLSQYCVLFDDGSIQCDGMRGDGAEFDFIHAYRMLIGGAVSIMSMATLVCALTREGRVSCWDAAFLASDIANQGRHVIVTMEAPVRRFLISSTHACWLTANSDLQCVALPRSPESLDRLFQQHVISMGRVDEDLRDLQIGAGWVCMVSSQGQLTCRQIDEGVPHETCEVRGVDDVTAVFVRSSSAHWNLSLCGLNSAGRFFCLDNACSPHARLVNLVESGAVQIEVGSLSTVSPHLQILDRSGTVWSLTGEGIDLTQISVSRLDSQEGDFARVLEDGRVAISSSMYGGFRAVRSFRTSVRAVAAAGGHFFILSDDGDVLCLGPRRTRASTPRRVTWEREIADGV